MTTTLRVYIYIYFLSFQRYLMPTCRHCHVVVGCGQHKYGLVPTWPFCCPFQLGHLIVTFSSCFKGQAISHLEARGALKGLDLSRRLGSARLSYRMGLAENVKGQWRTNRAMLHGSGLCCDNFSLICVPILIPWRANGLGNLCCA